MAGAADTAIWATSRPTMPMQNSATPRVKRRNAQSLPYSNDVGGRLRDSVFSLMGNAYWCFDIVDGLARLRNGFFRKRDIPQLLTQGLPLARLLRQAKVENIF